MRQTQSASQESDASSVPGNLVSLVEREVSRMVDLTNSEGHPNINDVWMVLKELNAIKWSVKQQGYAIGAGVYKRLLDSDIPSQPTETGCWSGCSIQRDIESPWFRYWCDQIGSAPLPHRKLWEFAFILQNLHEYGKLKSGMKSVGFGCGQEPLPSYFANLGISVTITDLHPDMVKGKGWAETGQHTEALESSYYPDLVDRGVFDELASLEYVDMNQIPDSITGLYDFCWSVCALEHLGSIQNGLDFIKNSMKTLKPGGVAIHTTEFNYTETENTIDNWPTVLFLRKHFEELVNSLIAEGHEVAKIDYDIGTQPLDSFIDLPPHDYVEFLHYASETETDKLSRPGHLKLSIDGFPSTCIGLAIKKAA